MAMRSPFNNSENAMTKHKNSPKARPRVAQKTGKALRPELVPLTKLLARFAVDDHLQELQKDQEIKQDTNVPKA